MKLSLKEFQQYCLKHQVAFVSYTLPGTDEPVTLFSNSNEIKTYKYISDIKETEGFLLSPFQSENLPVVVISDHNKQEGWEVNLTELPKSALKRSNNSIIDQTEIAFPLYSLQINEIRKRIRAGEAKKVVLSRTKLLTGMDESQLPDIFEKLTIKYTNAFVYLVFTPQTGIWLGATPELLLQTDRLSFSTMALASTKGFQSLAKEVNWTDKEHKEHVYVADYVRQKLTSGGYFFQEMERETIRAGNVVHLRTRFNGGLNGDQTAWKKLVELLYPTPAICGTESEATVKLIRKIEQHKREYYTGIVGPFDERSKTNLFINLRCMKVLGNEALLYAGGGILEESTPANEWRETEMKFNTLIQVIHNVKGKTKVDK